MGAIPPTSRPPRPGKASQFSTVFTVMSSIQIFAPAGTDLKPNRIRTPFVSGFNCPVHTTSCHSSLKGIFVPAQEVGIRFPHRIPRRKQFLHQ